MAGADKEPHQYVVELAHQINAVSLESQLFSAAPFHAGQMLAKRTDHGKTRKLHNIDSLYIVDTKAEGQEWTAEHPRHASPQSSSSPRSGAVCSKGIEYGTGTTFFNPDTRDLDGRYL